MPLSRRRRASVAIFFAVAALVAGCSTNKPTAPALDSNAALVARVDAILAKDEASQDDVTFFEGLTPEQRDYLSSYYSEHPAPPRQMPKATTSTRVEAAIPTSAASTLMQVVQIPCGYGWPKYRASAAYLTSLCGGDTDYMLLYTSIPNAYADRAALRGRSLDPSILATIYIAWGGKVSARVYENNYVYVCLGKRSVDSFGGSINYWNAYFGLTK